jgi:hypothetical protein
LTKNHLQRGHSTTPNLSTLRALFSLTSPLCCRGSPLL